MRHLALGAGAAVAAVVGFLALGAGPAAAIESPTFRLEPADRDGPRANLREALRPGRTTSDSVVVTNKTDRPLPLRLSVVPATVGPDGSVRLTGGEAVAEWVELEHEQVTLAPRSTRAVRFEVHAPRELPRTAMTMAILAEPAVPAGAPVAVLQRLAVMAYLSPARGSSLVASLGWVVWLAAAALVGVVAVALSPTRRGRRRVARLSALRSRQVAPAVVAASHERNVAAGLARLHAERDLVRRL